MTPQILHHHKGTVIHLLDLLFLLSDEHERKRFISRNKTKIITISVNVSEKKKKRIENGYFTAADLNFMFSAYLTENKISGHPVNYHIVMGVITQLLPYYIIKHGPLPEMHEYTINKTLLELNRKNNTIDTIVFGVLYTLEKYKNSIPAINVVTKAGDEHCGSGLLVKVHDNNLGILTNAHVVEHNKIKNIKVGGFQYTVIGEPIISEQADLAFIRVALPSIYTPNFILGQAQILKPILAVGYPRISCAVDQYSLVHRGEINGRIKTTDGQSFLAISCHVSPGNSGGPIISEIGELLGVVTRTNGASHPSIENEQKVQESFYHMAIPPDVIGDFLDSIPVVAA